MKIPGYIHKQKTGIVLLIIYALLLACATFIENKYGTAIARKYIYNNLFFFALQGLLVISFILLYFEHKMQKSKRPGTLILHFAFMCILSGSLITHVFGFEGIMHIREGETQSVMVIKTGEQPGEMKTVQLPFEIALTDFRLIRYPGSQSPSSYESDLVIYAQGKQRAERIYMNKVVYEQHYRIYQASYDKDEQGTILSINYDFWGMLVSYAGYFLLLIGFIVIIFSKQSRFRQLIRQLQLSSVKLLLLLCFTIGGFSASPAVKSDLTEVPKHVPAEEHASKMNRLLVLANSGRIEPFHTYSSKILRKLYKKNHYRHLKSEQVVLGIMVYPEYWSGVPLIKQTNQELHQLLHTEGSYISFQDVIDQYGNYKLESYLDNAYNKPVKERNALEKDMLKLDEKINIFFELTHHRMFPVFPLPGDSEHNWFSPGDDLHVFTGKDSLLVSRIIPWYVEEVKLAGETGNWETPDEIVQMIHTYQQAKSTISLPVSSKITAEIIHNKVDILNNLFKFYLCAGLLLLALAVVEIVKPRQNRRRIRMAAVLLIMTAFLVQTIAFIVRWYIAEQPPWSNGYESMVYISWIIMLIGLIFSKRSFISFALAVFLAGLTLLVAHMNFMDPEITPLVPVLKSPWLMFHVAVITASYGFFGMSFLLGLFSLIYEGLSTRSKEILKQLSLINELSMTIGLYLITIGIFLGAVWANESWGRYWGWDPKETWALITMLVYAIILHVKYFSLSTKRRLYNILSVYAFLTVLMTYFGVNYYLSGLHAYGNTDTPPAIAAIGGMYLLITLFLFITGRVGKRKQ